MLTVSAHRSVLLGDYANPPRWDWSGIPPRVAAVEVSLDGGPYRRLHPEAKSYRPPRPLEPGRHTLTVRVRRSGVTGFDLQDSAHAVVAPLPGRPPVADDPCYPAAAGAVRCGGSVHGQWPLRQLRLPEVWQALAAGVLPAPGPVVVAVLDTGYVRHPDLLPNLDTAAGYDFIRDPEAAGDGDGIDPDATDPATGGLRHGTAIAGIIAAHTGNGTGVAGMGWPWGRSRVTVMPVRVVAPRGAASYDVAQGLLYAAGLENDSGGLPRRPASIINLSFADSLPGPPDEILEDALCRVTAAGAIVVAAAGNHGSSVRAPANSRFTLAVAAAGLDGSLAPTSNRGPEIDVIAPGGDNRAGVPTLGAGGDGPTPWTVTLDQGTSIAAAHVSGALALLEGVTHSLTLLRRADDACECRGRPAPRRCAGRVHAVRLLPRSPLPIRERHRDRLPRSGYSVTGTNGARQNRSAQRDRAPARRRGGRGRLLAGPRGRRSGSRAGQGAAPRRSRGGVRPRQPDLSAGRRPGPVAAASLSGAPAATRARAGGRAPPG